MMNTSNHVEFLINRILREAYMFNKHFNEEKLSQYLWSRVDHYSQILNIPRNIVLQSWEMQRSTDPVRFYDDLNQPLLDQEHVFIFQSRKKLESGVGKKGFRCPRCMGVSSHPRQCDSNERLNGTDHICDWDADSVFGTLDRGIYVFIIDELAGEYIFRPISLRYGNRVHIESLKNVEVVH